jgi:hypothetical protein
MRRCGRKVENRADSPPMANDIRRLSMPEFEPSTEGARDLLRRFDATAGPAGA